MLLAPSDMHLPFTTDYEAAGVKIYTRPPTDILQKQAACSLQIIEETLPLVEELKSLGILLTKDGNRECEIG